ncbi:tetratricopeptide repeat protein [Amycolatopsis sp. NPDC049252]|uniref:AfsR/SARP family transcriptional regulator n=1 Tax=Amycolatopsis sp. NPDC049252 TaxID=3363933 RepID=UPI003720605A
MEDGVEIRLLGQFELCRGGVALELGDLQQRYILAVLVLHANRAVSTDRLIEIVWSGQAKPRTNLVPGYIAKLRRILRESGGVNEPVIDRAPTGYVLRVEPARIDAVRFAQLQTRAGACDDPAERLPILREAVALWRGSYLEDLDKDRVGAAELISPEEAFLDALGDLAELELAQGNHRWVRDRLRPVVHVDCTRHRLAGLLMRALTANGDRVQAMDVYHRTRAALDEFGMDVPVPLRKLARVTQVNDTPDTLPPTARLFTGRRSELAGIGSRLLAAAAEDRPGAVWVSGMPGIGKTALAVEAAHRMRRLYPDGRIFLSLNGFVPQVRPSEPGEALAALLEALGVPPEQLPGTTGERLALYRSTLAGTRTLVVLDNAASEDQVRQLIPVAPGCAALITSRWVGGLDVEDEIRLGSLDPAEAAQLFTGWIGAERTTGQQTLTGEVVARCGHVPLSVKLAAVQMRLHGSWSLRDLLQLLERSGQLHAVAGFGDAVAVSYQQLPDRQQYLFRLFGRLPGNDITVRAASALARCTVPEVRALLDGLYRASLIDELEPERYAMPDPLKHFAAGLPVGDPGAQLEALTGLLDFYLGSVANAVAVAYPFDQDRQPPVDRRGTAALTFADAGAARAWLSDERANLLAAIRFAAANGMSEHTWLPAVLLWRWHYAGGHLHDWAETLELARTALTAAGDDDVGLAHVLLRLSGARRTAGRPAEAVDLAAQALALWTELDDVLGRANALCAMALGEMDQGAERSAIAHFEAALADYERAGDRRGQANALSNLGQLDELRGDLQRAERRQAAAVGLLRRLGHTQGLAHALDNLGVTRRRLGRCQEVLADHQRARELAVAVGDRGCEAHALTNIGTVHRITGDRASAAEFQERAGELAEALGEPGLRAQVHLDRGGVLLESRDDGRARAAYLAALDLAAGAGDRGKQAQAHHGVARALHNSGAHQSALVHWRAAVGVFTELDRRDAEVVHREWTSLGCACRETETEP